MNEPLPASAQRPRGRRPRISLPVAIISFAGAVALALVLIAVILATDPGRADADDGASPSLPTHGSGLAIASPSAGPTSSPAIDAATPPAAPASAAPGRSPAPYPISGSAEPPLMAPAPDGGVYAAVREGDAVVVGQFGPGAGVRPGWPVRLSAHFCGSIHAAADGSLRLACSPPESGSEGLEPPVMRIFALDAGGRPIPGWPVDIESGSTIETIGNDTAVVIRPYQGDVLPDGESEPAVFAKIGPNGRARTGTEEVAVPCCDTTTAIGPRSAFVVNRTGDLVDTGSSELIAFGLDGVDWQTPIDGIASDPSFDAQGNAHVAVWQSGLRVSRMLVLDPDGQVLLGSSGDLSFVATNGSSPAGPEHPDAPTVAPDGSSFLVDESHGTSILALDMVGRPKAGWPFETTAGVEHIGDCGQDTGCGLPMVRPAVGLDGTLYVALNASASSSGGSLTALSPGGRVRSGWPVGLKRPGAQFWQIVVGSDGGIWALAAEPDKDGYDVTLLSIAPDSSIRGKITVVEAALIGP